MNEDEYLIYNYSAKNQKWYDATKNIVWFEEDNNAWSVKFKNSDEFYHISYSKMQVFDRVENVNYAEVFYKELPCFNIKKSNNVMSYYKSVVTETAKTQEDE